MHLCVAANEFPSSFESIVRKIIRLLFHVVAHLYAVHFKEVYLLGLHAHLNLTFAHLTALHHKFALIEPKETEILKDLEVALQLCESSNQEHANNNEKGDAGSTSDVQAGESDAKMVVQAEEATSTSSRLKIAIGQV